MDELKEVLAKYIADNEEKVKVQERSRLRRIYPPVPAEVFEELLENGGVTRKSLIKQSERPYPILYDDQNNPVTQLFLFNLRDDVTKEEITEVLRQDASNFQIKIQKNIAWVTFQHLRDCLKVQCNGRDNGYCLRQKYHNRDYQLGYYMRVRPSLNQPCKRPLTLSEPPEEEQVVDRFSNMPDDILEILLTYLSFRNIFTLMTTSKFLCSKISNLQRNIIINSNSKNLSPISPSGINFFVEPFGKPNTIALLQKIILQDKRQLIRITSPIITSIIKKASGALTILDLSGVIISSRLIKDITASCLNLQSFILGETTGDCDIEILCFLKSKVHNPEDDNETKDEQRIEFGVCHNNNFNGTSLATSIHSAIHTLRLSHCEELYAEKILEFLSSNDGVTTLIINNCHSVVGDIDILIKNLQVTNVHKLEIEVNNVSIQYWNLHHNWDVKFLKLEDLKLKGDHKATSDIINKFVRNTPNLLKLNISHYHNKNTVIRLDETKLEELILTYTTYSELCYQQYATLNQLTIINSNTSLKLIKKFIYINQSSIKIVDLTAAGRLYELEEFLMLQFQIQSHNNDSIIIKMRRTLQPTCISILRYIEIEYKPNRPLIVINYI